MRTYVLYVRVSHSFQQNPCAGEGLFDNPPLLGTGHPLLRSAVVVGQGGRNQQERGSQERPPARNKEKRDARHKQ